MTEVQKPRRKMLKVNQSSYARIFKELLEGPCTSHELTDVCGLHLLIVQSLMKCLLKHHVVHICGWEPDTLGRDAIAIYKLGKGKNKPRRRDTAAQRQARCREKKRLRLLAAAVVKPAINCTEEEPA